MQAFHLTTLVGKDTCQPSWDNSLVQNLYILGAGDNPFDGPFATTALALQ
jgi:hypothetical protein